MKLPIAGLPSCEVEVSLRGGTEMSPGSACYGILGGLGQPRVWGMSDEEVWAYLDTKNPANIIDPRIDTLH
jgi:hypothetical protein